MGDSEHLKIEEVVQSKPVSREGTMRSYDLYRFANGFKDKELPELPEYELLEQMVERACRDLRDSKANIRRNASCWLRSTCKEPWSFIWVCNQLRVSDKTYIRLVELSHEPIERVKEFLDVRDYAKDNTSLSSFSYLF